MDSLSNSTLITLGNAASRAEEVTFMSVTLVLYDYIICFGEEVEYFWSGSWSLSRCLYLLIRYLSVIQALFRLIFTAIPQLMSPMTAGSVVLAFTVPIMSLCQAVVTLRVWYLFPHRRGIRLFAIIVYVSAVAAASILSGILWPTIRKQISIISEYQVPALAPKIAWIYAPSLFIHTAFFALKVYRFAISPTHLQTDTLLWRFMKEGMFIYAFATASLIFVTIGVLIKDLPTRISALQANLATATTVVAICRVMLNIKSLAATAHVDPAWLLNHAELSRVYWRRGAADAEIFVEVGGGDIQLPVMPTSPAVPRTPASLGSMD